MYRTFPSKALNAMTVPANKVFQNRVRKYIHSFIPSIITSARQPKRFTSFNCSKDALLNRIEQITDVVIQAL